MQLGSENALKRGVSEKLRRRSTQCDRSQKSRCVMMFFPIIGGYLPALPDDTIPKKNVHHFQSIAAIRVSLATKLSNYVGNSTETD